MPTITSSTQKQPSARHSGDSKVGDRETPQETEAVYHSGYWQTMPEAFDASLEAQLETAHNSSEGDVSDDDLRSTGLLD